MSAVTLISHTEVGAGGTAAITFSSIPSTYDDLWLLLSLRVDTATTNSTYRLRFNSDTGSNYSDTTVRGTNSTITSFRQTSQTAIQAISTPGTSTTSTWNSVWIYVPNYRNTTNNKTVLIDCANAQNSTTSYIAQFSAGLWRSTAAVDTITISQAVYNSVQYSTATLYGVTKA